MQGKALFNNSSMAVLLWRQLEAVWLHAEPVQQQQGLGKLCALLLDRQPTWAGLHSLAAQFRLSAARC